jgi:predicted metal-dependent phosphotriesterase family hydrolase
MTGNPFFAGEEADYLLISRTVVPALLEAGLAQGDIDQMMVDNPRRFFAGD